MGLFPFRVQFLILACAFAGPSLQAVQVSITAAAGRTGAEILDIEGAPVAEGRLGLLIVDADQDGVTLSPGSWKAGTFYLQSDDFIVAAATSDTLGNLAKVQFALAVADDPDLTSGDPFYIAWFPTLSPASTELSAGTPYGLVRETDWVLPASGGTFGPETASAGLPEFQVQPAAGPDPVFQDALQVEGQWKFLSRIGLFFDDESGWVYFPDLNWVFIDETTPSDGFFLFVPGEGWWWTRRDIWPNFWSYGRNSGTGTWVTYDIGSMDPRWIYDASLQQWVPLGNP